MCLFSAADMLSMGEFQYAFVGVDVPETLELPLLSGSWSHSPCFLHCGHPTAWEVQTMAFHCCWMQIDIVCWEQGLNLFVVGVLLLDKWTQRWWGIVLVPNVWVWLFFTEKKWILGYIVASGHRRMSSNLYGMSPKSPFSIFTGWSYWVYWESGTHTVFSSLSLWNSSVSYSHSVTDWVFSTTEIPKIHKNEHNDFNVVRYFLNGGKKEHSYQIVFSQVGSVHPH